MTEKTVAWIEWVDSAQCSGWETMESLFSTLKEAECKTCLTIGFVLHESDKSITVSSTISDLPDQSSSALTIPKCSITKMYEVEWR